MPICTILATLKLKALLCNCKMHLLIYTIQYLKLYYAFNEQLQVEARYTNTLQRLFFIMFFIY